MIGVPVSADWRGDSCDPITVNVGWLVKMEPV